MFKGRAPMFSRFGPLIITTAIIGGCGGDEVATETKITAIETRVPTSDWKLVWSDEFESTELDAGKWSIEIDCGGGGNNEEQCYTDSPANLFVENGILNIVARPAEAGSGLAKPYTSSRINTKGKG